MGKRPKPKPTKRKSNPKKRKGKPTKRKPKKTKSKQDKGGVHALRTIQKNRERKLKKRQEYLLRAYTLNKTLIEILDHQYLYILDESELGTLDDIDPDEDSYEIGEYNVRMEQLDDMKKKLDDYDGV